MKAILFITQVALAMGIGLFLLCGAALDAPTTRRTPTMHDQPAEGGKRLLVFSMTKGYRHESIGAISQALRDLGRESGAFTTVDSEEIGVFDRETLFGFDAVCFNNTTGELPLSDQQKQNLLDFVSGGRGFIGIHSATDTLYQWPEYGQMVGAYFDGHPWTAGDTVTIRVEEPEHPIVKPFGRGSFELTEEIYQLKAPYDRSKLRVLLSLDTAKTDMTKKGIKRTDGDFALAWVKSYGKGRVFYTALGHNVAVVHDPRVGQHFLAGIQWALGQVPGSAEPRPGGKAP
jgi:type 1 glutamine amidotransferase